VESEEETREKLGGPIRCSEWLHIECDEMVKVPTNPSEICISDVDWSGAGCGYLILYIGKGSSSGFFDCMKILDSISSPKSYTLPCSLN
jgi:hypothetical protein